ncbi:efflux transporter outer membrane subunit [Novosphingobium sp. EMRT-2]|uniref:efflux transporter outer membrane subunit n=1 Tax=Novosphingobium sp. EMRT-2 TaxID=2571749 RepID=UPI0010BD389F|nr:efflux transporter outer membrane subunit [Novosphingobium sp. EMRT-2]QCI92773.1 efflux transporter outer membrane subunit [Novosphingobium sp. EMRT-2]
MRPITRTLLAPLLASCALLVSGCATVGPDYHGAPNVADTAATRGSFLRADAGTSTAAPTARWWQALGDPVLDQVIETALANAPDVQAANARIAQARAGLEVNKTALLPTASVSFAVPYVNLPGSILGNSGREEFHAYAPGFDTSWEIDLFGGTRRKIEAASARAEAAEAGLADARVTLSAEIARAYVSLRAKQAVLALTDRQAAIDGDLVTLARQRLAGGTAPEQPLAQARAQLAQTEADRAKTRADIVVLIDQIAVLAGREPGALDALLSAPNAVPLPPADVAVGDPALLLRNRPDIRMAERQLAAANADIGARVADKYPKISFTGLLGTGGQNFADVFKTSSLVGLALPQIKWSLFDGGRVNAQVRSAKGAYAEAEANFRGTVLKALQDAENSLTRFGGQRIAYGKALDSQAQAMRAHALQSQRVQGGTAGRSDALTAERQAVQAEMAAISARAELTTDFVAVEKALGLGWTAQTTEEAPK